MQNCHRSVYGGWSVDALAAYLFLESSGHPKLKPKSSFAMLGPSIQALTGMNECCRRELAGQVDISPRSLAFRKLSSCSQRSKIA